MESTTAGRRSVSRRPAVFLERIREQRERIDARWQQSADAWLPGVAAGSLWRSGAVSPEGLPRQGWKLHVSATIANAPDVLERIGPFLTGRGVHFKGISGITELKRLNCGLFHGYSQIGKAFTIYPRDDDEAVLLGTSLTGLTAGMAAPNVPYESRVAAGSPVFARYGVFRPDPDGPGADQLVLTDGSVEPDRRDGNPAWAQPPAGLFESVPARRGRRLLATYYRAYSCLSQRGKGGVYRAIDLRHSPASQCVIKEGRRHGELDLDGNDGARRVRREIAALSDLRAKGVSVPAIRDAFREGGNQYLVMDAVEGTPLHALLGQKDSLSIEEAIRLGTRVALLLAEIHDGGWVWRDLKAPNLFVTDGGEVVGIDFEGAAKRGEPVGSPWGSPQHMPTGLPESGRVDVDQDLFALGVVLLQIVTGEPPGTRPDNMDVDEELVRLIDGLRSAEPSRRPSAAAAADVLSRFSSAG
jgi:tRNA A-37 threonylcarbamoyl transferase component Bud32